MTTPYTVMTAVPMLYHDDYTPDATLTVMLHDTKELLAVMSVLS